MLAVKDQGVHGFTLDSQVGEFILTKPYMRIPEVGCVGFVSVFVGCPTMPLVASFAVRRYCCVLWDLDCRNRVDVSCIFSGGKGRSVISERPEFLRRGETLLFVPPFFAGRGGAPPFLLVPIFSSDAASCS